MKLRVLWVRGLVFTLLVPVVIALEVPWALIGSTHRAGGRWDVGWLLIVVGTLFYGTCLIRFLTSGGTPAIFFTRRLSFLIGEEPVRLVSQGLYRFSRNPMYVGVLMVVFGQALLYASPLLAAYGALLFVLFHLVVIFAEEPHLRRTQAMSYEQYCRTVPRWLGRRARP